MQKIPSFDFQKTIDSLKNKVKEKEGLEELELKKMEKGKLIQLPLWSEATRGTPNSILRGSLFAAIQGKDRKAMKRELIVDEEKLKIRFSGWQLDQSDLDVWEMALHLARIQNLGHTVYFSAHGFLKALEKRTGKSDHEWLKDVLARLNGAVVDIAHDGKAYFGTLIEGGVRDERTGEYRLEINPKLARLYTAGWTQINWEDRKKIGGKPLALWLYGYIASHTQIYPTKVETYHRLSGSANKCMRGFKRQLQKALELLLEQGLIKFFSFDGNLVRIEKIPSASQQKRLDNQK